MIIAVVLGLATVPAWAQTPQTAAPQSPPPPLTTPSSPTAPPPEKIAPPATGGASSGSLSDRLAETHGTVKPPAVDPGMTVHPPAQGSHGAMPVIPPPGTPGGNPTVVPK